MNRHGARGRLTRKSAKKPAFFRIRRGTIWFGALTAGAAYSAYAARSLGTEPAPEMRFFGAGVNPWAAHWESAEVLRDEEPIFAEPSSRGQRRGAARLGAVLPLFGAQRGAGCPGLWLHVGPSAFVCDAGARLSERGAPSTTQREETSTAGLPYRYFYVGSNGSFGYRGFETAEEGVPDAQFQPGFALAVMRIATRPSGDAFGLTQRGYWVPMRDLGEARAVDFQGAAFADDLGWVTHEAAPVFTRSSSAAGTSSMQSRTGATLARLSRVRVLASRDEGSNRYLQISEDAWLLAKHVTQPRRAAPPSELRREERWIDVDLASQTLVAYQGETPVFATLISSGKGRPGSETATPRGVHRIWVKLRTSDMSNLDDAKARENYALEAVPWVMFFEKGYGLHGTFWHSRFGEVRSHGCVNLTPRDAERLFHWTSPRLLPGWTAVFPTPWEPGTLIRVR